jgi:hypothetical protein
VLKDRIRLVVLNACYSRPQAEAINEHIDCTVGMGRPVSDEAAIEFAATFYQAIGFGRTIQTAFDLARKVLECKRIPGADIPQLFTRPGVDPREVVLVHCAKDADPLYTGREGAGGSLYLAPAEPLLTRSPPSSTPPSTTRAEPAFLQRVTESHYRLTEPVTSPGIEPVLVKHVEPPAATHERTLSAIHAPRIEAYPIPQAKPLPPPCVDLTSTPGTNLDSGSHADAMSTPFVEAALARLAAPTPKPSVQVTPAVCVELSPAVSEPSVDCTPAVRVDITPGLDIALTPGVCVELTPAVCVDVTFEPSVEPSPAAFATIVNDVRAEPGFAERSTLIPVLRDEPASTEPRTKQVTARPHPLKMILVMSTALAAATCVQSHVRHAECAPAIVSAMNPELAPTPTPVPAESPDPSAHDEAVSPLTTKLPIPEPATVLSPNVHQAKEGPTKAKQKSARPDGARTEAKPSPPLPGRNLPPDEVSEWKEVMPGEYRREITRTIICEWPCSPPPSGNPVEAKRNNSSQ